MKPIDWQYLKIRKIVITKPLCDYTVTQYL